MRILLLMMIAVVHFSAYSQPGKKTPACNAALPPLVLVHGFLASGDTWAIQAQRFVANGYCPERIFVYDWNTTGGGTGQAAKLDSFVKIVLKKTGAERVNLAGHSAGGGLCYNYCSDSVRAANISRYVHIASMPQKTAAGPRGQIPTLNIFSTADRVVTAKDMIIPGALNIKFSGYDHLQTATADSVFETMYRFFNGATPAVKKAVANGPLNIGGRVVYLGDNKPAVNIPLQIYEWDNEKAVRANNGKPVATMVTDSLGYWNGFEAKPGRYYEMQFRGGEQERLISYFFEPFTAPDPFVYLRAYPLTGMTGALLSRLPSDDGRSLATVFTANQACIAGRDRLLVNDSLISTEALMPASKSGIACFLYDDGDGKSSLQKHNLLSSLPFMASADVYVKPGGSAPMVIEFNGRKMRIPARPAKSGGVCVAVFK